MFSVPSTGTFRYSSIHPHCWNTHHHLIIYYTYLRWFWTNFHIVAILYQILHSFLPFQAPFIYSRPISFLVCCTYSTPPFSSLSINLIFILFVIILVAFDPFDSLYLPPCTFPHHQPLHFKLALCIS